MTAKIKPKGKRMTPEAFRAQLTELGLPQGKVADVWGCSRELVCRWANGKVPIPGWVPFALAGVPVLRERKAASQPAEPAKSTPGVPVKYISGRPVEV